MKACACRSKMNVPNLLSCATYRIGFRLSIKFVDGKECIFVSPVTIILYELFVLDDTRHTVMSFVRMDVSTYYLESADRRVDMYLKRVSA